MIAGGVLFIVGLVIVGVGAFKALKNMAGMTTSLDIDRGFGTHLGAMGIVVVGSLVTAAGIAFFVITLVQKVVR